MPVKTPDERAASLCDMIFELGLCDRHSLRRALANRETTGRRVTRIIVDEGLIDEDRLVRALAPRLGFEVVSLINIDVHERVLSRVPARVARAEGVFPVAVKRQGSVESLYVAVSEPPDRALVDELERSTGCRLQILLAAPTQLDATVERFYGGPASKASPRSSSNPPPVNRPVIKPASGTDPVFRPPAPRGAVTPSSLAPPIVRPMTASESIRTHIDSNLIELQKKEPLAVRAVERMHTGETVNAAPSRTDTLAEGDASMRSTAGLKLPEIVPQSWPPDPEIHAGPAELDPSELKELVSPASREQPTTRNVALKGQDLATREVDVRDEAVAAALGFLQDEADMRAKTTTGEMDAGRRVNPPETPKLKPPRSASEAKAIVSTFELPVDVGDRPSPFDAMQGLNLQTGLERTGIIPVMNFEEEAFSPPPVGTAASAGELVGASDIPSSAAHVRARRAEGELASSARRTERPAPAASESAEPKLRSAPEGVRPAPSTKRRAPQPRSAPEGGADVHRAPTQIAASDVSGLAGVDPERAITGTSQAIEPGTPSDKELTPPGQRMARDLVLTELPPPGAAKPKPPAADDSARALVSALQEGRSLNSAERAQLLLAVARVLLDKGIIDPEELAVAVMDLR